MGKKQILESLTKSVDKLKDLLPEMPETKELKNEVEELNTVQNKVGGIERSHIVEDKEANALTMQIKIDGTKLKGRSAIQAFEAFNKLASNEDKLLSHLANISQKNPPQVDEKIGAYFVRLANEDLIEIDDTIDHFINLFK